MSNFKEYATKAELPEGLWSGKGEIPELGDVVTVRVNGLGRSEVIGYFVEGGYIGVVVKVLVLPEWAAKRGDCNRTGVFGAEITVGV